MLLAIAGLLKTPSPTKGPAPRYGRADLEDAIAGVGKRLADSTFKNPIPRRAA
jgi:hypothetical protein